MLHVSRRLMIGGNAFENYILNTIQPTYYWKFDETDDGSLDGTNVIDYGTGGVNMVYSASSAEAQVSDTPISKGPRGPGKRFDDNGSVRAFAQVSSASMLPSTMTSLSFGFLFRNETYIDTVNDAKPLTLLSGAPVGTVILKVEMSPAASTSLTGITCNIRANGAERVFASSANNIITTRVASGNWHICTGTMIWGGAAGDQTDLSLYIDGSAVTLGAISYTPAATVGTATGHVNVCRGNASPDEMPQFEQDIAHVWIKSNGAVTLAQHQALNSLLSGAT